VTPEFHLSDHNGSVDNPTEFKRMPASLTQNMAVPWFDQDTVSVSGFSKLTRMNKAMSEAS
jgi:hypothetical protein